MDTKSKKELADVTAKLALLQREKMGQVLSDLLDVCGVGEISVEQKQWALAVLENKYNNRIEELVEGKGPLEQIKMNI